MVVPLKHGFLTQLITVDCNLAPMMLKSDKRWEIQRYVILSVFAVLSINYEQVGNLV